MWLTPLSRERTDLILSSNPPPRSTWFPGYEYRRQSIPDAYIRHILGVRVLDPIQTWMDIAACHGLTEGLVAADWLLSTGCANRDEMSDRLAEAGRVRGIRDVRKALKFAVANSDSAWESFARGRLIEAGITDIVTQAPVLDYRGDLLVAGFIIVEIDGAEKYRADPVGTIQRERHRERALQNAGFVLRRYSPRQLITDPDVIQREIRLLLDGKRRSA